MIVASASSGGSDTTLVIAVVGLALAAASLAWQAATFALTGSRVRADILRGVTGRGVLVTYPPDKWSSSSLSMHAAQGMPNEVVAVEVRNVGRMPASVQKITAYLENGIGLSPLQTEPPLAYRLEAGSSERWWIDAAEVRAAIAASKLTRSKIHIAVELGTRGHGSHGAEVLEVRTAGSGLLAPSGTGQAPAFKNGLLGTFCTSPIGSTMRAPRERGKWNGRCRARTSDLLGVNQALSQLS
jgi:hypothetical protein